MSVIKTTHDYERKMSAAEAHDLLRRYRDVSTVASLSYDREFLIRVMEKWSKLMEISEVRDVMSWVPQDSSKEIVYLDQTYEKVTEELSHLSSDEHSNLMGPVRRSIIDFLNMLYFSHLDKIPKNYLWEMKFRFQKLIAASLVLESVNLKSMNSYPMVSDIPQALIGLSAYIKYMEEKGEFDKLKEHHAKLCEEYVEDWASVYRRLDLKAFCDTLKSVRKDFQEDLRHINRNKCRSYGTEHSWRTVGVDTSGGEGWLMQCVRCNVTFKRYVGDDDPIEEEMASCIKYGSLAKECR